MWLTTGENETEAWLLFPFTENIEPTPTMIVAHGNGDLIDFWVERVTALRRMVFAVLLIEYPGYGRSIGEPSQIANDYMQCECVPHYPKRALAMGYLFLGKQ